MQIEPLIDCHQHFWDLSVVELPWLDVPPASPASSFKRNFLLHPDYSESARGANVLKAVYMEVDVAPSYKEKEADFVLNLCANKSVPTVAVVIGGILGTDDFQFETYIRKYCDSPYVKGVRQVLHGLEKTPAGHCLQKRFVKDVQLLGQLDLFFDICIHPKILSDAIQLIDACPNTQFILDHCGNADPRIINGQVVEEKDTDLWHSKDGWENDIIELAKRQNIVCKLSGIIARASSPTADGLRATIDFCIDNFGADRCIFGGDWPVCLLNPEVKSLSQWALVFREILSSRSECDQRKILHENAIKLYKL